MLYTINELKRAALPKIFEVYDVFQNHFGEAYTDLQGLPSDEAVTQRLTEFERVDDKYEISGRALGGLKRQLANITSRANIYVWWPRVTVTNEHDKSIVITDLYAKVSIENDGTIPYESRGFSLNRSSYTMEQWMYGYNHSGYLHSHIPSIPKNDLTQFMLPCLGTGPINNTIASLKNDYDEVTWMLFCQELAMYVTVESLTGGPYNRLEEVGRAKLNTNYTRYIKKKKSYFHDDTHRFVERFPSDTLQDFILYYLQNGHLKISYREGQYESGMPYYDFIIDISNSFIDFFNEKFKGRNVRDLLYHSIIRKVVVADGKFYNNDSPESKDVSRYIGRRVLTFKGQEVTLSIEENAEFNPVTTYLLDNSIAMQILHNVLKVINYRYKNEHINKERGEDTTSAYQNVRYI